MNHLIVPFTYINRDTGLRAAMKSQMVTVIPSPGTSFYKTYQNPNGTPTGGNKPANIDVHSPWMPTRSLAVCHTVRQRGHLSLRLRNLQHRPRTRTPLRSGTAEHAHQHGCLLELLSLTGDNVRERPYTNLYSLLTTKSNTYTVHYRVQSLKQTPGGDYSTWREDRDTVLGRPVARRLLNAISIPPTASRTTPQPSPAVRSLRASPSAIIISSASSQTVNSPPDATRAVSSGGASARPGLIPLPPALHRSAALSSYPRAKRPPRGCGSGSSEVLLATLKHLYEIVDGCSPDRNSVFVDS